MRPGFPERGSDADFRQEVLNRLGKLESAARLPFSSIGSGGLRVKDGGKITFLNASGNTLFTVDQNGLITFEADGSQMSVLDGSKLRFNNSAGTRVLEVTPAGGLKIYAANGTTEQVVLDSTGLEVDGGMVRAMDVAQGIESGNNAALTTTLSTLGADITLTKPSWAQSALVLCVGQLRVTDDAGGTPPFDIIGQATVDVGGSPVSRSLQVSIDTSGRSAAVTVFDQVLVAAPGSTVVTRWEGRVTAGTNDLNAWSHSTVIIWLR